MVMTSMTNMRFIDSAIKIKRMKLNEIQASRIDACINGRRSTEGWRLRIVIILMRKSLQCFVH